MQVAMIAQGEFMELLRAKSDDKKVIFEIVSYGTLSENSGRTEDKMQRKGEGYRRNPNGMSDRGRTYLCAGRI